MSKNPIRTTQPSDSQELLGWVDLAGDLACRFIYPPGTRHYAIFVRGAVPRGSVHCTAQRQTGSECCEVHAAHQRKFAEHRAARAFTGNLSTYNGQCAVPGCEGQARLTSTFTGPLCDAHWREWLGYGWVKKPKNKPKPRRAK